MPCRGLRLLLLALFLTGGHCSLIAATYAVGTCLQQYVSFSTIQSAVSSVPAGSIIKVCSGTYFEQVTITQPLTLEGVAVSNTPAGSNHHAARGLFGEREPSNAWPTGCGGDSGAECESARPGQP